MRTLRFSAAVGAAIVLAVVIPALAQTPADEPAETGDPAAIEIQAETLDVDNAARVAEFIGSVTATQGETVITADRLRIHYRDGETPGGAAGAEGNIDRVTAEGTVTIRFDDKVAESETATYKMAERVLTLTGTPARVTSGRDAITGSRIIVERETGRIRVESQGEGPVKAVVYPGRTGLQ